MALRVVPLPAGPGRGALGPSRPEQAIATGDRIDGAGQARWTRKRASGRRVTACYRPVTYGLS
ncbi:hypothetical protein GCM10018790_20130 [Kitasatospora xanthocidica]|nr:hypothetical protein GCM10018790_20130 [Kitasatospora xanthocidica]